MTRVVVYGAGKRVRGAVLPALHCLGYDVAGVVARSVREIDYGCGRVATVTSWTDFAAIDLIVTAVSLHAVPALLAELATRSVGHAVLLHDTPVLPPLRVDALRHVRAFRRAVIAEDNLALPPFRLARRLIDDGAIGALRRIYFFHNGFKHHALASLKLLARAPIRSVASRRFAGKLRQKVIDLGEVVATMYEPRDYATGKFLLEGERGAIADYDFPGARRIGYVADGPIYRGLTLDGAAVPGSAFDERYLARIGTQIPEASLMNTMKLRGLIDVIAGALTDSSPFHYSFAEGLADHLAIRIVDRAGYLPSQRVLARMLGRLTGAREFAERATP